MQACGQSQWLYSRIDDNTKTTCFSKAKSLTHFLFTNITLLG